MEIEIGGSKYRISCGENQEKHLKVLASLLGRHVSNFSEQYGSIGNAKLLVLAGLTIADQLYDATGQIEELKEELNSAMMREEETKEKYAKQENEMALKLEDASNKIEELLKLLQNNPFEGADELPDFLAIDKENDDEYNRQKSPYISPKSADEQLENADELPPYDDDNYNSDNDAIDEGDYNEDLNFIPIDDEGDESIKEQDIKIKFSSNSRKKKWE